MGKVVVIDYGTGNLYSVAKALEYVADSKQEVVVSSQRSQILAAERVVFPGQGAVGQCMQYLADADLIDLIKECADSRPFFGICMGLQLLMQHSEEDGGTDTLDIIPGTVVQFPSDVSDAQGYVCKIPHMGWNQVDQRNSHPLWQGMADGCYFYFAHSYYVQTENDDDVAATTNYTHEFTSAIAKENIFATQFHPEKSQQAGLTLLHNFLSWDGCC